MAVRVKKSDLSKFPLKKKKIRCSTLFPLKIESDANSQVALIFYLGYFSQKKLDLHLFCIYLSNLRLSYNYFDGVLTSKTITQIFVVFIVLWYWMIRLIIYLCLKQFNFPLTKWILLVCCLLRICVTLETAFDDAGVWSK